MDGEKNISVIIPYMESDEEKPAILKRCVDSLSGYGELLLIWNWKMGFAKPINKGLALAKGDFLLVCTDDVYLDSGNIQDLCDPKAVTSPKLNGQERHFYGAVFCMPRWVYEKTGGLYEGYEISYWDDDDFEMVCKTNGIPMRSAPSVNFRHPEGGRTLHTFPDHDEFYKRNAKHFKERWHETAQ